MHQLNTAERIALYVGGGLVLLGTFGIGLLEMIGGAGHPVGSDGQIVHETLVPIEVRSSLILLGLLVWGGYAVYRFVASSPASTPSSL